MDKMQVIYNKSNSPINVKSMFSINFDKVNSDEMPVGASRWINPQELWSKMNKNDKDIGLDKLRKGLPMVPLDMKRIYWENRYNLLHELYSLRTSVVTDEYISIYEKDKLISLFERDFFWNNPEVKENFNETISQNYPLLFIHIPKAAGTSVNHILNIKETHSKRHLSLNEIQSLVNPKIYNTYTKFGIIRNPFDRMVSLYFHRMKNWNCLKVEFDPNLTFEQWFWNLNIHLHEFSNKAFMMSSYDLLIDDKNDLGVDYTLRFENLEKDWNDMFEVLDLKAPKLPKKNKSKHKHYSEYYKCETGELIKQFVYERFKNDFKYFGYEFEEK
tara:strand:+ start:817 stop:1803 length:987 start_codon:yes stop_codon:yes gene_type:complete